MKTFYLGTHEPSWLARSEVPLFVSRRRLERLKKLPRAVVPWAMDSGGFTELSQHGRWTLSYWEYASQVRRYRDEIGSLEWAAPMDWMCEPEVCARTGLHPDAHIARTVYNFLELVAIAPELPWIPVLQGWTRWDYLKCIELYYEEAGVDLLDFPWVGVGTLCRRQNGVSGALVIDEIRAALPGIRLHGFGFKVRGLDLVKDELVSADSLAWSYDARRLKTGALPGCTHKSCSNCFTYAMRWYERLDWRDSRPEWQQWIHTAEEEESRRAEQARRCDRWREVQNGRAGAGGRGREHHAAGGVPAGVPGLRA